MMLKNIDELFQNNNGFHTKHSAFRQKLIDGLRQLITTFMPPLERVRSLYKVPVCLASQNIDCCCRVFDLVFRR